MSNVYMIENQCYDEILDAEIAKLNQINEVLKDIGSCPRSIDEVYSMGIKVQNFLGDIYSEMLAKHNNDESLQGETSRQLVIKKRIQQLADHNLNQLLDYFYNNGGPIIEPPVSEPTAKGIQPFFSRITVNALTQIVELTDRDRECSLEDINEMIRTAAASIYDAISKLYAENPEVKAAFEEIMDLHRN